MHQEDIKRDSLNIDNQSLRTYFQSEIAQNFNINSDMHSCISPSLEDPYSFNTSSILQVSDSRIKASNVSRRRSNNKIKMSGPTLIINQRPTKESLMTNSNKNKMFEDIRTQ
jgi:hypothetical protein